MTRDFHIHPLTFLPCLSFRSSSVALIEMPPGGGTSAATVSWPFIAGASSSSAADNYVTSAAAWAMPISGDSSVARFVSMLSSYSYNSLYVPDVLGYPSKADALGP
jgi:hypothetical protein